MSKTCNPAFPEGDSEKERIPEKSVRASPTTMICEVVGSSTRGDLTTPALHLEALNLHVRINTGTQ